MLNQVAISPFGTYSANIGSYVGPVVAEASGSYLDEATGTLLEIPAEAPIRAAIPLASGKVILPVTALTEIAVQTMSGIFTPTVIQTSNAAVSSLFRVNIVNIQPVPPNAGALRSASSDQETYTLALCCLSQLALTNNQTIPNTLTNVVASIDASKSSMTETMASQLNGALKAFTENPQNQTGIIDSTTSPLANIGGYNIKVTVSIPGGNRIGGVQGTISIPVGVTPVTDGYALIDNDVGAILEVNPNDYSITIGVLSSMGFLTGDFLTFTCRCPSARAVPSASEFGLSGVKVLDPSGAILPISISLSVAT